MARHGVARASQNPDFDVVIISPPYEIVARESGGNRTTPRGPQKIPISNPDESETHCQYLILFVPTDGNGGSTSQPPQQPSPTPTTPEVQTPTTANPDPTDNIASGKGPMKYFSSHRTGA